MQPIYHFDHGGLYLGQGEADPDQQQPGKYLVPAFATTTPPPPLAPGKHARRTGDNLAAGGDAWTVEDAPDAAA